MKKELPAGFDDLSDAGKDGVYRERSARLGDDGLWEISDAKHTEEASKDDGVEIVVTTRGKRTVTKTRQITPNEARAKRDAISADDAGKALRTSATRGGLFNVEETDIEARESENAKAREKDYFLKSETDTEMKEELPGDFENLNDAGKDGVYRERSARLGDDGLWEISNAKHTEERDREEIHVTVTSRAHRKATLTRQTDDPGKEPLPTTSDVGKEYRKTRTRGGLYNVENVEVSAVTGTTLMDCSKDLFQHTQITGRTENDPDDEHVDEIQDLSGKYSERQQQLGDDGLWGIRETTHNEKDVRSHRIEERATRHGLVIRTTHTQGTDEGQKLTPESEPGKERIVEKTRGARRNLTTVELKPAANRRLGVECEKTAFLHTQDTLKVEAQAPAADPHVNDAGDGVYRTKRWTLSDDGAWESHESVKTELERDYKTQQYEDAFGTTTITDETSHGQQDGGHGGKTYTYERLVRSVEAQMTNGLRYNVRTREEAPKEVDSGWQHFEKVTDYGFGVATFYDFIVFRNARKTQVKAWITHIEAIQYTGFKGKFENHPHISIQPNKFGLWDGSIGITTTFTPKAYGAGGNNKDDNWETDEIEVVSVNFVPLSATKVLKLVTTEFHVKGGGVGRERLEARLANGVIKGSQYAYHPGGQSYQYDLIVRAETKGVVMDMPGANAQQMWNGQKL